MPLSIERDGRNNLPRYTPAALEVVSRYLLALRIAQGNVWQPNEANPQSQLQNRMVSLPPNPRGDD